MIPIGARTPVVTLEELDELDDDELLEGYRDGFAGEPEPGDNRSKAYWHGWKNGRVDGGHALSDPWQKLLAWTVVQANRRQLKKEAGQLSPAAPEKEGKSE